MKAQTSYILTLRKPALLTETREFKEFMVAVLCLVIDARDPRDPRCVGKLIFESSDGAGKLGAGAGVGGTGMREINQSEQAVAMGWRIAGWKGKSGFTD